MGRKKYHRILLKLSGESLVGEGNFGIDTQVLISIALQIKELHEDGIEISVVVGGGNIFRGIAAAAKGMDRSTADYIGMLATVMNAMALQDALEHEKVYTRVQSAVNMADVAEPYIRRRAIRHLEKKRIVIFAAGTGNPYFSTDTAAALRALEVGAEAILKATKVDGIYDADPKTNPDAKKFDELDYIEVLNKELRVMDATATSLCMDHNLPIIIFNLNEEGNIRKAAEGQKIGTIVRRRNNGQQSDRSASKTENG